MRSNPPHTARWLEVLDAWFRHATLLAALLLLVSLLTAAFLWKRPRQYRSEALLLVRNERVQATIGPSETGQAVASPVTENVIRTEVELLQSRGLLMAAAHAAGVLKPDGDPVGAERTLDRIVKSIRVSPVLKADMIRVEYTSTDMKEGTAFLRHMLKLHLDRHIALHSRAKVDLFEKESVRLGEELRQKERELARFQQANDVHLMAEQKSLLLHRLAEVQSALRQSEIRFIDSGQRAEELTAVVSKMPARLVTAKRRMPNQYTVERLQTMLVELENRRIELQSKYVDGDRLVLQNAEQLQVTRKALADALRQTAEEETTDLNANRTGLEGELFRARVEAAAAASQKAVLERQHRHYRVEMDRLEALVAEHDHLSRQVREVAERRQLHLRKSEESRIEAALDARRVTNVVVAQEPTSPVRPEAPPYLAAAGLWLIGSLAALGAVALRASVRGVIHSAASLEKTTGVPVLATVPLERSAQIEKGN
ncbi:MAG: hypothetical protein SFV51_00910 [Bryobacteraceae bacterium]|nr:hypothetical protein [Bryobacteraceae bacterium]